MISEKYWSSWVRMLFVQLPSLDFSKVERMFFQKPWRSFAPLAAFIMSERYTFAFSCRWAHINPSMNSQSNHSLKKNGVVLAFSNPISLFPVRNIVNGK